MTGQLSFRSVTGYFGGVFLVKVGELLQGMAILVLPVIVSVFNIMLPPLRMWKS